MASVPEITSLFTQLASHLLQTPSSPSSTTTDTNPSITASISSLTRSLNFNEEPRVRVLDAALSLMCFKAPEFYNTTIESMVTTIITVLSSSISSKVLPFEKVELLQVGSEISRRDCMELVGACLDICGKLEDQGHGMLSQLLLHAVLRVAVSSNCYQSLFSATSILCLQPRWQKKAVVSKLHTLFPENFSNDTHKIPLRLLLWYLDPLTLKNDISKILRESVMRPFLCLKKELHERMTWRSIILCLVLSPTLFIETTTLLDNWFMVTGLESILGLQIQLVSAILDMLSQPTCWGLPIEVASKLPFSDAYFSDDHELLAKLVGPISCETFLDLFHLVSGAVSQAGKNSCPIFEQSSLRAKMIDHKSNWVMLKTFPAWFYFASVLLFSKSYGNNFLSKCISVAVETEHTHHAGKYRAAASSYLACIMCPMNKVHFDLLTDCLSKLSDSWIFKQFGSAMQNQSSGFTKESGKTIFREKGKDKMASKESDGQRVRPWLEEFQDCHARYLKVEDQNILESIPDLLFKRIPLGIFIGCSSVDREGCELLLHYALTGRIIQSKGDQSVEKTRATQNDVVYNDDLMISCKENDGSEYAVRGALLVFSLFDAIEDMSSSLFEKEESRTQFLCELKTKAVRFLVRCIKKLLQFNVEEDEGRTKMMDLQRRLMQWRCQGAEIQGSKSLDAACSAINCKILSYEKL